MIIYNIINRIVNKNGLIYEFLFLISRGKTQKTTRI